MWDYRRNNKKKEGSRAETDASRSENLCFNDIRNEVGKSRWFYNQEE